jgi:hypothetical protein
MINILTKIVLLLLNNNKYLNEPKRPQIILSICLECLQSSTSKSGTSSPNRRASSYELVQDYSR